MQCQLRTPTIGRAELVKKGEKEGGEEVRE